MIKQNIPLKDYSNYKIGGKALYFLEISSEEELIDGIKQWQKLSSKLPEKQRRIFVLGGGTNVLFSDGVFKGLVIRNLIKGIEQKGEEVVVGAGVELSELASFCIDKSLSGLEWAGGLPGTVGGAVRGNAGAYKGEIKDNVLKVISTGLENCQKITRTRDECGFGYRTSVFKIQKEQPEIILTVKFTFKTGDKDEISKLTREKIDARNKRHPLEYPNLGSIFKNVPVGKFSAEQLKELSANIKNDPFPVIPAAKIIFLSGLSGQRIGDIMVSEKHTNFLVNVDNGKAEDVKRLMQIVKKTVKEKFNVELEEEIMYVD